MRTMVKHKKLIIVFFLLSIVFIAYGMGIDDYKFFSSDKSENYITFQNIEVNNHLQSVVVEKNNIEASLIRSINLLGHSKVYKRNAVITLLVLAILVLLEQSIRFVRRLNSDKVGCQEAYLVAYIHDSDGRKRFSQS